MRNSPSHDFALSQTYVVLLDLPVTFSLTAVAAGRELPHVWNPEHQTRVGLLPRDASPDGRLRRGTVAVNRLIQRCGDNGAVVYADIGGVLLDPEGAADRMAQHA